METTAHGDPDLVCSYSRLLAAPLYSSTADEEVHDVLCSVTDELRQLLLSSDTVSDRIVQLLAYISNSHSRGYSYNDTILNKNYTK